VENEPHARVDEEGARGGTVSGHAGGHPLDRATNHVNNYTGHLVLMVHTAPGKGRVICLDPSHEDVRMYGTYRLVEWDNNEQIRRDFNGPAYRGSSDQ
jgi:hypothetical protein